MPSLDASAINVMPSLRACKVIGGGSIAASGLLVSRGGKRLGLVRTCSRGPSVSGWWSFSCEKILGGETGVITHASNGKAVDFLKVLYSFPGVDTIIHGITESAEHDQVQRRCRNHHLRREHTDLCIAR